MDQELKAILESLTKKVNTLQDTVDRFGSQLNDDRKDINDIKVSLGKNLAVSEGTRDAVHDQTGVMVKKIQENLQPIPDIVGDSVAEAVKKKKGLFR